MKSKRNSVVTGLALLALSLTVGGSLVRAEEPEAASLQNIAFDPIAKIVAGIEQRLAGIETTVMAYAKSFASERISTQQLCVSDAGGAETCISKAQLDALLKILPEVSHDAALIVEPSEVIHEAAAPIAEPSEIVHEAAAPTPQLDLAPVATVEAVEAVKSDVTLTATIAAAGEDATKEDEPLYTGTVTSSAPPAEPVAATEEKTPVDEPLE
jgi:hypothetical protein